jgi:serine/threonine protein kinase/tetratricopeptide (TPR) repeat protein
VSDSTQSARSIFLTAIEQHPPEQWPAFLDEACGADASLRARVEQLLQAHLQLGTFHEVPQPPLTTDVAPPVAEGPGTVIGPYKLLQQIGEGGMGVVYMAEQEQPVRRRVALKIIKPGMDSRQVVARFEAERQALAMMDHLHIAKVFDAGTTGTGRPYFVMELVHGVPITQFCDENQLTPRQRLELFVPVCQAIQHAHQKGIIHRDIKPSNVLVTMYDDKPVPKVIDFGVAKAVEQRLTEKTMFTQFGTLVGTFEYMSPEQAEMNAFGVDTRSDIYSLGVLLYELLTGTTPLERERLREAALDELVRLIKEEEPPRPSVRLSSSGNLPKIAAARRTEPARLSKLVKGEIDWIVMKCLEKDRARRYDAASGLAKDVERYLHDEAVEACPPSAGYKLRKLARRYKTPLFTAAAFVALLALGAVVSSWLAVRRSLAEREAWLQRDAAREASAAADEQRRLAQEKEQAAQNEANKAKSVIQLLQELLGTANPDSTKGSSYTVRQMLDDFETGLGERLQGQPEAEADVRTTVGLAYSSMHLVDKAEKQLQRALELRRQVFGPDHQKVAETLTQLAWNLRQLLTEGQKRGAKAEQRAREALAVLNKLGDQSENRARALLVLAWALQDEEVFSGRNKLGEVEAMFREALALAEQCAAGKATPLVPDALNGLAQCLIVQQRIDEAKLLATRAVSLHRLTHGDTHPETAQALLLLGLCYFYRHEYAEAEPPFREALTIGRRAHGSDPHQVTTYALRCLAYVLDAQYKDDETEAVLRECMTAWNKPDLTFPTADQVLAMRGLACWYRGDYADAEEHFRGALEARGKSPGLFPADLMSIVVKVDLGITLYLQGKHEDARATLRALVPMARLAALPMLNVGGPHADSMSAAVLFMGGSGQTEEQQTALTMAQRGVQRARETAPEALRLALIVLARAQQMSRQWDRAMETLREAQTLLPPRELFGRRVAEKILIECLKEKGDLDSIEKVLREGLSKHQAALPQGHPEIAAAQVNLAGFLSDRRQYAEAEPLLLAAFESLKAHPQANSASLKRRRGETLERLVQLYDAWGKADEAARWRHQVEKTNVSGQPAAIP